ncbi:hypothetical protein [Fibrobacter succinogenes]|uniref:hypothetical protein n=1 Tax=Fibrobacter succinogenes TaxID=833 RepID=UPI001567DFAC|nr:hypothetical protein [Fibrobacter succinogenes]
MNRQVLYDFLECKDNRINELKTWLKDSYFPEIINRLNSDLSRKRFGLYQGEVIPTNERNLTDVRTRLGLLFEFELARISNGLLQENGIDDLFWCYVVANRFPDLEVRNINGERFLRFEVKCLQCVAEEKSANFDTLKKDIDPKSDYVVVCLWDWSDSKSDSINWDSVPVIYKIYVFNAYSLASLRDFYWLNTPPKDVGDGNQGFDVRFALTCKNGLYIKEGENYGKINRFWNAKFSYVVPPALNEIKNEYIEFQDEIVFEGFKVIAQKDCHLGVTALPMKDSADDDSIYGYQKDDVAFLFSPRKRFSNKQLLELAIEKQLSKIVKINDNYRSSIYVMMDGCLEATQQNIKPKRIKEFLHRP